MDLDKDKIERAARLLASGVRREDLYTVKPGMPSYRVPNMYHYKGVVLVLTCGGYPEAYEAYDNKGRIIGTFRLRHGFFGVSDTQDLSPFFAYEACPHGNGEFEDYERKHYLREGILALKKLISETKKERGV